MPLVYLASHMFLLLFCSTSALFLVAIYHHMTVETVYSHLLRPILLFLLSATPAQESGQQRRWAEERTDALRRVLEDAAARDGAELGSVDVWIIRCDFWVRERVENSIRATPLAFLISAVAWTVALVLV